MPYISKEEVAQKRKAIKAAFPNYKISVVGRHYSSIEVAVMTGPIQLLAPEYIERGNESVNPFYITENFKTDVVKRELLEGIYAIINDGNYTASEDGDYGSIPSFYTRIEIGKWDKSYEVVSK